MQRRNQAPCLISTFLGLHWDSPGWKWNCLNLVYWKSGEHLCTTVCCALMRYFTHSPLVNAYFLRMCLYRMLFWKGSPRVLLCVQCNSQRCPKALQQGRSCRWPLPQSHGAIPSAARRPKNTGARSAILGDCQLMGWTPPQLSLFPFWYPIRGQTKGKFLAWGQPGLLQFIMKLPWNYFVVTLSVPNEFTIISAFCVNPSGSNNDSQFFQKGCCFPWQKMMT